MNLPFKVDKDHQNTYSISNRGCEPIDYDIYESKFSEGGTSCNLGSINLVEFISTNSDNEKSFAYQKFAEQIKRSCYYLDLVIDTSKYPLEGIELNTKSIRPIGLGIMGCHDVGILLGYPFETSNGENDPFGSLMSDIAKYLAIYSLKATTEIVTVIGKKPFDEVQCVIDLFKEYARIYDINTDKVYIDKLIDVMSKEATKFIPPSIKASIMAAKHLLPESDFNVLVYNLFNGNIRNSRRLSIAPTGTISLICDVSSGIEPNFAFTWKRKVNTLDENHNNVVTEMTYFKDYIPEEYRQELEETGTIDNPLYKGALEIDYKDHIGIVSIFAKYIDASISKTINLPNSATVEEIENIYLDSYTMGIKGITIYRDGSRSMQPLTTTKKKEEPTVNNTNDGGLILGDPDSVVIIERNPTFGFGTFIQIETPYGRIHVSAKFNGNNEMREVFITLNKSGEELKAITESLSRLISISLQDADNFQSTFTRVTKTLRGIRGFESWVYDSISTGEEVIVRSIPDLMSYVIPDLDYMYKSSLNVDEQHTAHIQQSMSQENYNILEKLNKHPSQVCPQCGSTSFYKSDGCDKCLSCGYSHCGVS